jgi:hypothetical protein
VFTALAELARIKGRQYICITGYMDDSHMPRTKNEVLTIRTTAEVKVLLKLAAEREHRSAASMVEVLRLQPALSGAVL